MNMNKFYLVNLFFLASFFCAHGQKTQVLLVGTFHFANPGLDATRLTTMDIKSDKFQQEVQTVVDAIRKFHPDAFFVEYPYQKQAKLDSLYLDFLNSKPVLPKFELSEIYQLAFKLGKQDGLKQIVAINYYMGLPFDSLMTVIEASKQTVLNDSINAIVRNLSNKFNNMVASGSSLSEILLYLNSEKVKKEDVGFYTTYPTQAGEPGNFAGARVASEWYRRNINMFSLIQQSVKVSDKRIVILLGASHVAILEQFFKLHPGYEVVELKDVLFPQAD